MATGKLSFWWNWNTLTNLDAAHLNASVVNAMEVPSRRHVALRAYAAMPVARHGAVRRGVATHCSSCASACCDLAGPKRST